MSLTIPPADLSELPLDEAVELIVDWFHKNFEGDTAIALLGERKHSYAYTLGGPYSTRYIVEAVFMDSAEAVLVAAAVDRLDLESRQWVPSLRGRLPIGRATATGTHSDPAELHSHMLARVKRLEQVLARLPVPPPIMGHNNPPKDDAPYTREDYAELASAIAVLKAQALVPPDQGKDARAAAEVLEKKAGKLRIWFAQQGDNFATEFVKESGKEAAKWAPRALIAILIDHLFHVSSTVAAWLAAHGFTIPL